MRIDDYSLKKWAYAYNVYLANKNEQIKKIIKQVKIDKQFFVTDFTDKIFSKSKRLL